MLLPEIQFGVGGIREGNFRGGELKKREGLYNIYIHVEFIEFSDTRNTWQKP